MFLGFSPAYPTQFSAATEDSYEIEVELSDSDDVTCAVSVEGSSLSVAQITAGTSAAIISKQTRAVTANSQQRFPLTGLTAATKYEVSCASQRTEALTTPLQFSTTGKELPLLYSVFLFKQTISFLIIILHFRIFA